MKKFRILFLSLIASVCLLFGAAVLAACGDTGENGGSGSGNNGGTTGGNESPATTYYTVTLDYDSTKGTVTKSDSAAKDGYVKDETVTLTVTANENYTVETVKAGTTTLTAGADGKYSFKVAGNTTVSVTFAAASSPTPTGDPVVLDAAYYGTYKDMEGKADDLVVSATGIKWGDKDVFLASPYEDGDTCYTVTVGEDTYYLYVHDNGQIDLLDAASEGPSFLKEGVTLGFTVTVSVNNTAYGTATLDPQKDTYTQDEEVTLTVTPGEDYEVESVTLNGGTISLENGVYTFNVSVDTTIVVTFKARALSENALVVDAKYYGTYHDMADTDKSDDLVLSKWGTFWGADEVFLAEDSGNGEYIVTVGDDADTQYVFRLNDDGTAELMTFGGVSTYFLKDGVKLTYTVDVVVNNESYGTATLSPAKQKYEQGESVTLTITLEQDCSVVSVMKDFEPIQPGEDGKYTFTVTGNTDIYVNLKKDITIPTEFQGVWTNIADSKDTFTLTGKTMTWTGHEVEIEISEYIDYETEEVGGVLLMVYIDGDEYGTQATLKYGTNAIYLSWNSPDWTEYYENYYVHGNGMSLSADTMPAGAFTQVGGTKKLTVSDAGAVSIDNTALTLYYTGDLYITSIGGTAYRINFEYGNYLTIETLDPYATNRVTEHYLRDQFTVKPHALLVGEWTGADDVKLNFKQDGTVEVTGAEGTTIILLASSILDTSLLLTKGNDTWEAAFRFMANDTSVSFDLELVHDEFPVEFTSSKQAVPLVLDAAWQTGYTYNGDEDVPFKAFVADTTGLGFVDQFNKFIEGSYSNAIELSDTEYLVFKEGDWGMITMYLFTLNSDKTITVSDGENEYVYEPGELVELDVVEITLEYESNQGSANIAGETADDWGGNTYTLAIPAAGSLTVTILVDPQAGFKVKSVKVGEQALTDEAGNNRYSYTVTTSGEVTIVIEFDVAELEPLAISDTSLYGSYSGIDSYADDPVTKTLTVDASGVKFDNEVVKLIEKYSDTFFKVMIGTTTYTLTFDTSSNAIMLSEINYNEDYYLRKDGGSTETTFSVTIGYDDDYTAAMGSAVADEETYSDGDTVTITITPGTGYTVDSVTVDGETATVTAGANGTYTVTFEIHADAEVVVTFKAAAVA